MFGLGFGEIILILVVALLVFGPERLPELARTLGKSMAELRRAMDDVRSEFRAPSHDFERSLRTEPGPEPVAVTPAALPNDVPANAAAPVPGEVQPVSPDAKSGEASQAVQSSNKP